MRGREAWKSSAFGVEKDGLFVILEKQFYISSIHKKQPWNYIIFWWFQRELCRQSHCRITPSMLQKIIQIKHDHCTHHTRIVWCLWTTNHHALPISSKGKDNKVDDCSAEDGLEDKFLVIGLVDGGFVEEESQARYWYQTTCWRKNQGW